MDDYPAAIADFLEDIALKVRGLTVDKIRDATTWTAVGLVVGMIVLVLAIFLLIGLFRLLAYLVGVEAAYAILGGLFIVVGAFLWRKRMPKGDVGPDTTIGDLANKARNTNG